MELKSKKLAVAFLLAGVIFLGAFLLFQVQPLIGRYLLPWFGGTPEVWTTCMLFFQVFLLGGYAYAHWLLHLKSRRLQMSVHLVLLAASAFFLPIFPNAAYKPEPLENPILKILLICTATIGLPYLVLSATSPLIQGWFARSLPERNPYRLYALSNTGSLLALASFPFVFEPAMTRAQTVWAWSGAFAVFAVLCSVSAMLTAGPPLQIATQKQLHDKPLDKKKMLLWLALPAAASVELLATTNTITMDVAVIPFLWVLPLVLYLLSFIICFEHQRWYVRPVWVTLFIVGIIGAICARLFEEKFANVRVLIGLYVFMLFSCCMVCHGEVYRLRPDVKHLTLYYLLISIGGAVGGFFVAVVAPLIFNVYIEMWLGILAAAAFLLVAENYTRKTKSPMDQAEKKRQTMLLAGLLITGALGIMFMGNRNVDNMRAIDARRNFFGVLSVWEEAWDLPDQHKLLLQHGTTFHGLQFLSPEKKNIPTAYYSVDSGIGLVMRHFRNEQPRRIGIVGLGVGTLAAYGKPGDVFRFYEINADVEKLARKYFTYLEDSQAQVEVVLGDARLTMENEKPQNYDVLVLDAFSSDAVPTHLLTKEAMELYVRHINDGGLLAFHISTMHLDLQSVVWRLADEFKLQSAWIEAYNKAETGALSSDWILLSKNSAFLESKCIAANSSSPEKSRKDVMLWTDDHINLLQILKKSRND